MSKDKKEILNSKLKSSLRALSKVIEVTLLVSLLSIIAVKAPELHGLYLRSKVGSKSYMIKDNPKSGGGTGFAIKAPSGKSYILTNDHVCGVSSDGKTVLVQTDENRYIRRNILLRSDKTDLCLIEGMPGVEGLSLGSEPGIGQIVASVGHPSLMPVTLSRGEIIGSEDVKFFDGYVSATRLRDGSQLPIPPDQFIAAEQCSSPKNEILTIKVNDMFEGPIEIRVCLTVIKKTYITNALIQPGNSGSPIVNFWGNVVGVMFASDRYNWGRAVNIQDIQDLLSVY